jgi:PKD repeat protein
MTEGGVMGRIGRTGARRWAFLGLIAIAGLALSACVPVRPRPPTPPPEAAFAVSTAPLVATFTDQSTGVIKAWSWDFGDGETSTDQNPTHAYEVHGDYLVTLTVTGPGGSDTATQNVTVLPPAPVASFTVDPPSGTVPLTVLLTSTSSGDIDSQAWDLDGDGVFDDATGPTATQTFTDAGDHTVALSVTGPGGTSMTSQTVPATLPPPPVVVLRVQPDSGVAPLLVALNGCASTGAITTFNWDFDSDGVIDETGPCQTTHTFAAPGTYLVTLNVTGPGGNTSAAQNIAVSTPPPVASFTAVPPSGQAPLSVQLTDTSTGAITSRTWDLGNGDTITSPNPAPITYTYDEAGTYTVTLTVTGPGGTNATSQTITATAPPPPPQFQPVLNAAPLTGTAPLVVTFNACPSTGENLRFSWDFDGDGTDDQTGPCTVTHTYATGTHNPRGTVREAVSGGGTHSQTWQIVVSASPLPNPGDCGPGRCDVPPPNDDCIPPACDPRL